MANMTLLYAIPCAIGWAVIALAVYLCAGAAWTHISYRRTHGKWFKR